MLENGATALVIPALVASNLPSFQREVEAYLILDHSACAETNRATVAEKARSALESLPPSITRVRVTWANYEQEDVPGETLSREAALAAIAQCPSLPARGGFCAERVIARILLSQSNKTPGPEPAGYVPLFIVIPAPGSVPIRLNSLSAFSRLAPDLPAYALFNDHGVTRIPFQGSTTTPAELGDFVPSSVVVLRNGDMTACIAQDKDTLLFDPTSSSSNWQFWNPSSSQFEKLEPPTVCNDSAYQAGLALWSRHRNLAWTPAAVDAALPDLIKDTRTAGLLIPEAAFIVLETKSQEVMLGRKENQSLNANHALEFDNAKTEKAPAPLAVWLIIPAFWLLWRFRIINIRKL